MQRTTDFDESLPVYWDFTSSTEDSSVNSKDRVGLIYSVTESAQKFMQNLHNELAKTANEPGYFYPIKSAIIGAGFVGVFLLGFVETIARSALAMVGIIFASIAKICGYSNLSQNLCEANLKSFRHTAMNTLQAAISIGTQWKYSRREIDYKGQAIYYLYLPCQR
jgi:hypothetical protein